MIEPLKNTRTSPFKSRVNKMVSSDHIPTREGMVDDGMIEDDVRGCHDNNAATMTLVN